jgi:hypothetical protein
MLWNVHAQHGRLGQEGRYQTRLGCTSALSSKLHTNTTSKQVPLRQHKTSTPTGTQASPQKMRTLTMTGQRPSRKQSICTWQTYLRRLLHPSRPSNPNQCVDPTASHKQQPAQSPAASNNSTNGLAIHKSSAYNNGKDLRSQSPTHFFSPSPSRVPTVVSAD